MKAGIFKNLKKGMNLKQGRITVKAGKVFQKEKKEKKERERMGKNVCDYTLPKYVIK